MIDKNNPLTPKPCRGRDAIASSAASHQKFSAADLKQMCRECGADDVGIVEIDRLALVSEKEGILSLFPWTKSLVSFVGRINR